MLCFLIYSSIGLLGYLEFGRHKFPEVCAIVYLLNKINVH